MEPYIVDILKIMVFSSIFFVWVIRYSNIIEEFKTFGYPNWLRDLVGIFKIAFAIMLFNENMIIVQLATLGISVLMICAFLTHVKIKSFISKMLPSATLLAINLTIYFNL